MRTLAPSPCNIYNPPLHLKDIDIKTFLYSVPLPKIIFDLATLVFIFSLLVLSLFAFASILYLHERSRRARAHHLQNFNSLWMVRLFLVSLVWVWAVNEILRLPFVRRKYLFPFEPSITLEQEAEMCELNVVLSLGLLQPGFFITLLFLVNVSIKKRNPSCVRAILSVLFLSCPTLLLQIIFVYFTPFATNLPRFMFLSSVISTDLHGDKMVLCTCPLFSWMIYGGFSITYAVAFSLSCWRVMVFVINKGISYRINLLATTVMVAMPAQIVCLVVSLMWIPENDMYGEVVLAMFLSVACCMAVAVVLLVVKPVQEALQAVGDSSTAPVEPHASF